MNTSPDQTESLRIDKWLWAARFFKTRSLAAEAVNGGKVHINGQRVKPARPVRAGDQLRIQRGSFEFVVDVLGINDKRRPAKEASLLYRESEASQQRREQTAQRLKMDKLAHGDFGTRRPDKRQRRHIVQFRRNRDGQSD